MGSGDIFILFAMDKLDFATSFGAVLLGAPKLVLKQELLLLFNPVLFILQLNMQRCSLPPTSFPVAANPHCSQRFSAELVSLWIAVSL